MSFNTEGSSTYLEHLNNQVKPIPLTSAISFERYLVTGQGLLLQADSYRRAGDEANLYLFLMRFASLIMETLPKHPKFNKNNSQLVSFKMNLVKVHMSELERLKIVFSKRTLPKPVLVQTQSSHLPSLGMTGTSKVNWTKSGAPNKQPLPPRPSDEMPIDVIPPRKFKSRPSILTTPPPNLTENLSVNHASEATMVKHSLLSTSRTMNAAPEVTKTAENGLIRPTTVSFPSVQPPTESLIDRPYVASLPMEIPLGPQEVEVLRSSSTPEDGTTCSCSPPPSISSSAMSALSAPLEKKREVGHTGLRNIHISVEMLESFLAVAKSNTRKEIETCAILAGQLRPDLGVLEINTLLVPPQKGTRDQVEMVDEEVLLGEVLSNGLMVLGWIHTHPVFQCFLSSIDVHTTLPYQLLLEEAVAIVMAPTDKKRKCGVFRLTTPGGLELIKNCEKRGFHEHKHTRTKQPIYETVSHVFLDPKAPVKVKDLR